MKITIEGEFEEIRHALSGLIQEMFPNSKLYADQAAASASRADTSAKDAERAAENIKKGK